MDILDIAAFIFLPFTFFPCDFLHGVHDFEKLCITISVFLILICIQFFLFLLQVVLLRQVRTNIENEEFEIANFRNYQESNPSLTINLGTNKLPR